MLVWKKISSGGKTSVTVNFFNGDELINSQIIENVDELIPPDDPTKEGSASTSWTFMGWSLDGKTILNDREWLSELCAEEVNYYAVFESGVVSYTVRFLNADGTVLQESLVPYGRIPSYNGIPPEYNNYLFQGWDRTGDGNIDDLAAVTGNIDYVAIFVDKPTFAYQINDDNASYRIIGIGTITDTDITIPNEHNGLPVTRIAPNAFDENQNIVSVTISEGIQTIDNAAFRKCSNLTSVFLPERGLAQISSYAFRECTKLTTINIPSTLTVIESYTFNSCTSLTDIILPEGVTTLSANSFEFSGLKNITLPTTLTKINAYAFRSCNSLSNINLPINLKTIGPYAFSSCYALNNIVFPDSLTTLGEACFSNSGLIAPIIIPPNVTTIPKEAFNNCYRLAGATLNENLTTIGDRAFLRCRDIDTIIIPSTVTSIGASAFCTYGDGVQSVVVFPTIPPELKDSSVFDPNRDLTITVPAGCGEVYKAADGWSSYADIIVEAAA